MNSPPFNPGSFPWRRRIPANRPVPEPWARVLVEGFPEGYIPRDFICPMQASAKYPPATAYGAEQVIYAHGQNRFHDSIEGCFHGVEHRLVSGNFLVWTPAKME